MASPIIEASSGGLKLSYLRFISDSAPGFVLLLLMTFAWGDGAIPSYLETSESRVLAAAILFMLATPVGLAVNAVSYFLLGESQAAINRTCFLSRWWPIAETRRTLFVEKSTRHFRFTARDWAERTDVYEEIVESYRPDLVLRLEHLRGLKRFSRCIALLAFAYFIGQGSGWPAFMFGIGGLLSITLWGQIGLVSLPRRELLIVMIVTALFVAFAGVSASVHCEENTILPAATLAFGFCSLFVAGMVDFYQRGTIALYLHLECPDDVRDDRQAIRDAIVDSARRLR